MPHARRRRRPGDREFDVRLRQGAARGSGEILTAVKVASGSARLGMGHGAAPEGVEAGQCPAWARQKNSTQSPLQSFKGQSARFSSARMRQRWSRLPRSVWVRARRDRIRPPRRPARHRPSAVAASRKVRRSRRPGPPERRNPRRTHALARPAASAPSPVAAFGPLIWSEQCWSTRVLIKPRTGQPGRQLPKLARRPPWRTPVDRSRSPRRYAVPPSCRPQALPAA